MAPNLNPYLLVIPTSFVNLNSCGKNGSKLDTQKWMIKIFKVGHRSNSRKMILNPEHDKRYFFFWPTCVFSRPPKINKLVPRLGGPKHWQVRPLLGGLPLGQQDPRPGSLPAEGALHTGEPCHCSGIGRPICFCPLSLNQDT